MPANHRRYGLPIVHICFAIWYFQDSKNSTYGKIETDCLALVAASCCIGTLSLKSFMETLRPLNTINVSKKQPMR